MHLSPKIPKLFGILSLLLLTFTVLTLQAQSEGRYYYENVIRVKFDEASVNNIALSAENGVALSGVNSVDMLNMQFNAVSMKRVISDGGKFKARREAFGLHRWYEIRFNGNADVPTLVSAYESDSNVEIAEAVLHKKFGLERPGDKGLEWVPNDPQYASQYNWNNTGQTGGTAGADVSAPEAWNIQTGDPGVVISVHDSGFDTDHPDLADALWVNPNPTMGDLHGWNFADNNSNIYDSDGHGSHVSGTIAAINDNGVGVSGLAGGDGSGNGVRIMVCKVFGDVNVDGFAESYIYAADNGAVISQNSWGYTVAGNYEQVVLDAIDYFIENAGYDEFGVPNGPIQGGLVIFAAGNSGSNNQWYPGYYEPVYAVAGTNHFDRLIVNGVDGSWFGSNYGEWVDISAPGMFIISSVIDGYDTYSGTSMACPHVSAAAGLVASQYPGLTNDEVMLRVLGTADDIDGVNPAYAGLMGSGRLNAYAALVEDDGEPPLPINDLATGDVGQTTIDLTWTVPDVATPDVATMAPPALYDIRYSTSPINDDADFNAATQVENPPIPLPVGETQDFTVTGLIPLNTYYFAVKSQDIFANKSTMSNVVSATTLGAPLIQTDPAELYAEVPVNTQVDQTLTIENVGEGPLDWSIPGYEALAILNNPNIEKNIVSQYAAVQLAKGEEDTRVGNPVILGAGGPDNAGYTWIDSNEPGGPSFNWYEISAIGTELTALAGTWDGYTQINLPFEFTIYEESWNTAYVGVNGWIHFGTTPAGWYSNQTIPNAAAPNNFLAVFWDDLDMRTNGAVYTYHDAVNNLFIVQWTNNQQSGSGSLTFQAILTPWGGVTYQYLTMTGTLTSATVGIENSTGTDGLQVVFNAAYIANNLAVKINTPRIEWLSVTPTSGTVPEGGTTDVTVTYDATGKIGSLEYTGDLGISSNDPSKPTLELPVTMLATGGSPEIATSTDALDFGTIIQGTSTTLPITISNVGSGAALQVTDITFDDPAFSADPTSLELLPGVDGEVIVTFAAADVGVYNATMTIQSNDAGTPEYLVTVTGESGSAPIVSTDPTEFIKSLETGTSTTDILTITNTGASDLNFMLDIESTGSTLNYSLEPSSGDFKLGKYPVSSGPAPADGEPVEVSNTNTTPIKLFEESIFHGVNYGDATNFVSFQGNDPENLSIIGPYPGANFSNAADFPLGESSFVYEIDNLGQFRSIDVATGAVTNLGTVGTGWTGMATDPTDGTIFLSTGTGLYTLDVDGLTTTFIGSYGGLDFMIALAADGDGVLYGYSVQTDMLYSINKSTGAATQIGSIGFDANYGQGMTWDSSSDQLIMAAFNNTTFVAELRLVDRNTGNTTLLGVLGATTPGSVNQLGWIATPVSGGADWLIADITEGTLGSGESIDIELTFDATNLVGNVDYFANINVESNDPVTPVHVVPVTLSTTGTPDIAVDPASLDFGDVFVGTSKQLTTQVTNTGTAVLNVTAVTADNPAYSMDANAFTLLPGQSKNINVTLTPTEAADLNATLTIANNAGNVNVSLVANGAPFLVVSEDQLMETLEAGETVTRTVTVTNSFNENLPFAIYIRGVEASVQPTFYPTNLVNQELLKWFDMQNPDGRSNDPKRKEQRPSDAPKPSNVKPFPLKNLLNQYNVNAYGMEYWYDELAMFDIGDPEGYTFITNGFGSIAGNFAYGNLDDVYMIRSTDNMLVKYNIASNTFTDIAVVTTETVGEVFVDLETDYETGALLACTYSSSESVSKIYVLNRFLGTADLVGTIPYRANAFGIDDSGNLYFYDYWGDNILKVDRETGVLEELGYTGYTAGNPQSLTFDHTTRRMFLAAYNNDAPWFEEGEYRAVDLNTGMTSLIGKIDGTGDPAMGFIATQGERFLSTNLISGTIAPGASLDLQVIFNAANLIAGDYQASVVIVGEELDGQPSVSIPAFLTVTGDPLLAISTNEVTFEPVFENATASPQYLTFMNVGTADLTVNSIGLTSDAFGYTAFPENITTPFILEPGEPRVIEFTFTPTDVGVVSGTFSVNSDGGNASALVSGEGLPAPVMGHDYDEFVHQAYPGQLQEYLLTMSNPGGNPLIFNAMVGTMEPSLAAESAILEEGFEDPAFPPDGWTNYAMEAANTWQRTTVRANTGLASAYYNDFSGDQDTWLVTPQLSLSDNSVLEFYDYTAFAAWYEYSGLWISTGSPDPADGDYIELMEYDDGSSTWTNRVVDLSAYDGQDVYLAFRYMGNFAHEWYIDDVYVYGEAGPWLTIDITEGEILPGESMPMTLNVNATGMTAGTYESGVILNSNDPLAPISFIPFTLTVVEELVVTAIPDEDDEVIHPNEIFTVPISVSSLNDLGVSAFQFTLEFDGNLLEPIELMVEGTLSEGLLLESNLNEFGQVSVGAVEVPGETPSSTPILFAIQGDGVLLNIKFKALEELGDGSFSFSEVLFNEGTPAASGNGGDYTVAILYGDANLNAEVTAFDATTVLQDVVGIIELSELGELAANVSGDASVTAFDASLILHYVAGLIDIFPVEVNVVANNSKQQKNLSADGIETNSTLMKNGKQKESATISSVSKASVMLDKNMRPTEDKKMSIPIQLNDADAVYSVDLRLKYDEKIINIDDVKSSLPEGWIVMHNIDGAYLNVAMAGVNPLPSGAIGSIIIDILEPSEEINFTGEVKLNESSPQSIEIDLRALPFEYDLSQNYPNPFNPVTTIKYQLPEVTEVNLTVYNQLGQVVKTLVKTEQEAGYYKVQWNGTNDFGRQIASGVYLFRIQAGSFVDVKKMIFLK